MLSILNIFGHSVRNGIKTFNKFSSTSSKRIKGYKLNETVCSKNKNNGLVFYLIGKIFFYSISQNYIIS